MSPPARSAAPSSALPAAPRTRTRGASARQRAGGGPAATRRRLLDAAGALFAARGFRGATLREIAERAGANLAAVNYHFGSKEALYLEVAREHFERLERRLAERGAGVAGGDDLERCSRAELEARLHARVRTVLTSLLVEDPIHAALMQRELLDPSDALPVIVRRWVLPLRGETERLLARLAPELGATEIARATFSVMGQIMFYLTHRPALLLMMGRRRWPAGFVDELAEHVTAFTLGGIERQRAARAHRPAPRGSRR